MLLLLLELLPGGLAAEEALRAAAGDLLFATAAAAAAVLPAASPYSIQAEKLGYSVVEIGDSQWAHTASCKKLLSCRPSRMPPLPQSW
jgi:hypothetical protein